MLCQLPRESAFLVLHCGVVLPSDVLIQVTQAHPESLCLCLACLLKGVGLPPASSA